MHPNTEFTRDEAITSTATFDWNTLQGKSVVLTGGASGIGEQILRDFVAAGAFVTFSDVAIDLGEKLLEELGARCAFVSGDVLDWQDQLRLFKTALERSPSRTIDIVIANAGVSGQDDVFEQASGPDGDPVEPKLSILKVNLIGVMYTIKLALFYLPLQPIGIERDRCIIITASMSSYLDHVGSPQYNASKHGVRGLMKSIRQSGPSQDVRVNMIAPWFIATRIRPKETSARIKAGGVDFCDVGDASAAVAHLASAKSINGRVLAVVPRSMHVRGHYDLERDDWNDGDYMTDWMNASRGKKSV